MFYAEISALEKKKRSGLYLKWRHKYRWDIFAFSEEMFLFVTQQWAWRLVDGVCHSSSGTFRQWPWLWMRFQCPLYSSAVCLQEQLGHLKQCKTQEHTKPSGSLRSEERGVLAEIQAVQSVLMGIWSNRGENMNTKSWVHEYFLKELRCLKELIPILEMHNEFSKQQSTCPPSFHPYLRIMCLTQLINHFCEFKIKISRPLPLQVLCLFLLSFLYKRNLFSLVLSFSNRLLFNVMRKKQ